MQLISVPIVVDKANLQIFDFKHSIEKFVTEVLSGLKLTEKSSHKGLHKVWILQNMLIPRFRWPLLIYEISISLVNCIQHKISSCFKKMA